MKYPYNFVVSVSYETLKGFSTVSPWMRLERRNDLRLTVGLYLIVLSIILANWSCQTADNLYESVPFEMAQHNLNISKRDD